MNQKKSTELMSSTIQDSINKGVIFLVNNQKNNGSICLFEGSEWNIWETVVSLQTLGMIETINISMVEDALKFILDSQRKDGSYYYKVPFQDDEYCMETTALCIDALGEAGVNIDQDLDFIFNTQQSDGSWEIGNPYITKYRNFPSITGFVLRTLLKHKNSSESIEKGIRYLKQTQLNDGSWGSKWMYYDTPFYAMHVILDAFNMCGMHNSEEYRKAIDYVTRMQDKDGSWCIDTRNREKPSIELRTSLALYTLLVYPTNETYYAIQNGIEWLIRKQQPDGRWDDGGIFVGWPGKREDIYSTAMPINVLKKYQEYMRT